MITSDFYNHTKKKVNHKLFTALLPRACTVLIKENIIAKNRPIRIECSLIGDAHMRRLNKKYHHKDQSTDVISLSFFTKKSSDNFAGEIFISLPYARRQASAIGQSLSEELRFLFVHGLLHLFGYDHKIAKEERHMTKLAYLILGRL